MFLKGHEINEEILILGKGIFKVKNLKVSEKERERVRDS